MLRRLLDSVQELPLSQEVLSKLLFLLCEERIDPGLVCETVYRDPALVIELLRRCNESQNEGLVRVNNLKTAVLRLGFAKVYQTLAEIVSRAGRDVHSSFQMALWSEIRSHSMETARLSRALAAQLGLNEELVFTSGLLHDIGKFALSQRFAPEYAALVFKANQSGVPILGFEKTELGVDHAEVGACLLERWHLPEELVHAVCFHHNPRADTTYSYLAACVQLCDYAAHAASMGSRRPADFPSAPRDALGLLGVSLQCFQDFASKNALPSPALQSRHFP